MGNGRSNGKRAGRAPLHLVRRRTDAAPILITGGAGFIGANLADRLLSKGMPVLVFDNLSRPGVRRNLRWLHERHPRTHVQIDDVRDAGAVASAVERCRQVYHFAAQVAVTTSVTRPTLDFDVNVRGTLNVLEAIRRRPDPPPLVLTSTNKVYGVLHDIALRENGTRYEPVDPSLNRRGVAEDRPLSFHSPYGCSKGAADQYTLDYARTYGLDAVVLRMSCIYGPCQFGTEDQGWVAHFMIRALEDRPITVYGDGLQVRDLLFIDDLVDALELAQERMPDITGRAYNIGGGPANAASLLDVLAAIGDLNGRAPQVDFGDWRPGDQRYYVSDTTRFRRDTSWRPRVALSEGLARLHAWLLEAREPIATAAATGARKT